MAESPVAAIGAARDESPPLKGSSRTVATLGPAVRDRLASLFPGRERLEVTGMTPPSGAGVNNETLMVDLAWGSAAGRTLDACVLRIESDDTLFPAPPFASHFQLYRLVRNKNTAPVPEVYGLDESCTLIDRPFYFLEKIEGEIPADRPSYHAEGWVADRTPAERTAMWRNAVATMSRVHRTATEDVAFLQRPRLGRSGFEQELTYNFAYMDEVIAGDTHPILTAARDWLDANAPADPPTAFAWGDARPQNLIFRGTDVVALLDWDMASLAGPEADLAWWTVMEYTIATSRGIALLDGWGSPKDTIALWETLSGRRARDMNYHLVFAAFRAAIIVMRMAKSLDSQGKLPPHLTMMKTNNVGVQYLASLLDLPKLSADSLVWPGLDPRTTADPIMARV